MINWKTLDRKEQIEEIAALSYQRPCIIYKHSTRCSLSSISRYRLESGWDFMESEIAAYFLDVIEYRGISQEAARYFEVHHESPQLLLIRNGECIYDASHLDISAEELKESIACR